MESLDYTEKSFVVFGEDTKNHKDKLKELGGRYNPNLTHPVTKEKMSAWIFSNKQKEKVKSYMENGPSNDPIDEIVDPIQRLGLTPHEDDKKTRTRKTRKIETPKVIIKKVDSGKQEEEPRKTTISLIGETPEFEEVASFTMIVPKIGMKVHLKNEMDEELILDIVDTKKNKDGYTFEFTGVRNPKTLLDKEDVINFVMVGKEWRRISTEVPHWMNFI
jgi:hypothetical protein